MLNRREFLQRGGLALLGAAVAPYLGGCGSVPELVSTPPIGTSAFDQLASSLRGQLLRAGDAGFSEAASPWNLRYSQVMPQALARCSNVEDIATSLAWTQQNQVPFVVRSGGHSYSGFSVTDGLMIDISRLNQIAFDAGTGLAVVGAGARNRDVYSALRPPGVAITHGRCKAVGVAGLVLGGGIGFNMRARGLTCDQLVETRILTARGETLVCNAQQNADAFWACRGGGGGNFGVNTSLTFQTFPVSTLTVFEITWESAQRAVFEALLQDLATAPNTLGAKVSVVANVNSPLQVSLLGQLVGTPDELNSILSQSQKFTPAIRDVQLLGYWDGQEFLSEEGLPTYYDERSRYVYRPLSSPAVDTIFDYLSRFPGTSLGANWKFFLQGGAIAQVPAAATAFVHRQALMISSVELDWQASDDPKLVQASIDWVNEFHQAMAEYTSAECYQNFIDIDQKDYLQAYYGDNLPRLKGVKRTLDPQNAFHYPQSIPTV